jgi:putative ABC transport system permease protein
MVPSAGFFVSAFLARRDLRAHRGRTLLTLLGIILGVAVVLAIQVTNQTTLDSLRGVFDLATGQADLLVVPVNASKQPLDQDILARAERVEGVAAAAPSVQNRTLLARDAGSWQIAFSMTGIAAGNFFQLYGVDPELDPQVRVYILESGSMPKAGKYELVIPSEYAGEKDLQIGDDLEILVADGSASLEVVGLLAAEGVAILNDGAVGFTSLEVAQDLFARSGELDEISLSLAPAVAEDPNALEAFKTGLSERLGEEARVVYPAARGQLVSQMLATYQLGLTFFSVIAIFVGAFLIYNAFSMTIVERTREIGMLRAVGMSRAQILRMVLAEAGFLSLVGSAIGLIFGYWLAQALIRLLGDLAAPTGGGVMSVSPLILLQSIAVGIGVTLVAALIPGLQAARISPLEALRARSRHVGQIRPALWITGLVLLAAGLVMTYRVVWPPELLYQAGNILLACYFLGATLTVPLVVSLLERLTRPLANLIYGSEGAIGSANIRRSIGRTTLTVASLMVALTMIISIKSLAYSFETDMQHWIDNALGGDLYVRAPLPMRESFANQLESVPGVNSVSPARILTVQAAAGSLSSDPNADDQFYYEAIDPAAFLRIGDMEFAAKQGDTQANWARLSQGEAVFISSSVADRYDLRQGDQIVLLTRRGERPFYIAAEVMDFGGQGQVIYGTYEDMHRWFNEKGVDRFTIDVDDAYAIAAVSQEIESRYQDSHHVSVQTTEDFKTSIIDRMSQSFRLFDVLGLIGVIIGALGVINTLTMNVIERQREIGGLRSLGMTRLQVLRMVLAEALALGVMGGIYGLLVGTLIANVTIIGTNQLIGYDLAYRLTPDPYLIGALIALGVVQLAAVYPARRAARVNIVEAIKHE